MTFKALSVLVGAIAVLACSTKSEGDNNAATDETEDSSVAQPATDSGPLSLTVADIDGFEKGLKREIELVREGKERASVATTPVERGNAIQSTFEENTMKNAVPASGLSFERYHLVRQTLSRLLTTLDFQGKIEGPQSVDTTLANAEMRERLESDPYTALDSASGALLKSRLSRIVPLWVEYVNMTVTGG